MPTEKIALQNAGKARIGIIAGGGDLAFAVIEGCLQAGNAPVVAGLAGSCDAPRLAALCPSIDVCIMRPERTGSVLDYFRRSGVRDIVLIGRIKRPSILSLRPDLTALSILLRHLPTYLKGGDDALLRALRGELEARGFMLRGVQDVLPDLVAQAGPIGGANVPEAQKADIAAGWRAAKEHGRRDLGQSVCILDGAVIAVEGKGGTDALIRSCKGQGRAILVKTSKPQQDMALDMPAIGPQTIEALHESGFAGCVVEAGATLIHDRKRVCALADRYGVFVVAQTSEAA